MIRTFARIVTSGQLEPKWGDQALKTQQVLDACLRSAQQDGKVVPVRLALFAEMVKDRPWTPETLARVGGTEGIGVEVYPEAKKVGQQLQYAERRGFRLALIAGPDEFAQDVWKVKDLIRREEHAVPSAEVAAAISKHLLHSG